MNTILLLVIPITASPPARLGRRFPKISSVPSADLARMSSRQSDRKILKKKAVLMTAFFLFERISAELFEIKCVDDLCSVCKSNREHATLVTLIVPVTNRNLDGKLLTNIGSEPCVVILVA